MEYEKRGQCVAAIREALGAKDQPSELAAGLADEFANLLEVTETPTGGGLPIRGGSWVIRNEDLKLFAAIKDSLTALAAAGFVIESLTVAGIVALGVATAELIMNAWHNVGKVTPDQLKVLIALEQRSGRGTTEQIYAVLNPAPPAPELFSKAKVESLLQELGTVPTRSDLIGVVKQHADGSWIIVAI